LLPDHEPEAEQLLALLLLQLRVELLPLVIELGFAVNVTVGATLPPLLTLTVTALDVLTLPAASRATAVML
jgi:hypothetical protein